MPESAPEFDPVIHSPVRFKIMLLLAARLEGSFNEFATAFRLSAGNLGSHLRALEEAKYIESARRFIELKPRVRYRITPTGRDALRTYCAALEVAVRGIRDALDPSARPGV